jgi:plastocyanin
VPRPKLGRALLGASLVVWVVAMGACGSSRTTYSPSPMPTPTPVLVAADVTITINGMLGTGSYSPNPGAVRVGQKVAWRNADSISHTATGSGFDTGAIAPGQTSAPVTFAAAGSIDYHCSIHPTMVGTLSVTQ